MKLSIIYQIAKADYLERTRRFSFLAICAVAMFLAFFSVPDVEAPFVSIAMEPNIFSQGTNSSWIPIAIALCGGLLFPVIGLSYVKNNISMDRNSGLLYLMQAMNMKKRYYIFGKFLSSLLLLTVMWLLVITSAAIMIPFQFPNETFIFYEFISPFLGIYPGIVFVAAFAVILESMSFVSNKAGNVIGIIVLFVMFLINYSNSEYNILLLRIFDFSNYKWIMESINNAVIPIIGRNVQETGILVPGGMFAGSNGGQELIFHGLLWNSQYFMDKIMLLIISVFLLAFAIALLEPAERKSKIASNKSKRNINSGHTYYTSQFISEFKMIFKGLPKSWFVLITSLWIYSIFAPMKYVQGYIWIVMLIFSVVIFSQMGCREYEHSLTEYFMTIKSSLIKQIVYSYLWGTLFLLILSLPVIMRFFVAQNYSYALSYIIFSLFIPALACFLGEYSRSRKAFETVYLLFCFLLINMPTFLFQRYMTVIMIMGTIVLIFATFIKRLQI